MSDYVNARIDRQRVENVENPWLTENGRDATETRRIIPLPIPLRIEVQERSARSERLTLLSRTELICGAASQRCEKWTPEQRRERHARYPS